MVGRRRAMAAQSMHDDEAQDNNTSMDASDCVPLARFGYHRLMLGPPVSTPPHLSTRTRSRTVSVWSRSCSSMPRAPHLVIWFSVSLRFGRKATALVVQGDNS